MKHLPFDATTLALGTATSALGTTILALTRSLIQKFILLKQDYKKYNWHGNKNTDGLVNRLASNLLTLNQAHRVAWLIGQEKILK